jgi:hypothetical protein
MWSRVDLQITMILTVTKSTKIGSAGNAERMEIYATFLWDLEVDGMIILICISKTDNLAQDRGQWEEGPCENGG